MDDAYGGREHEGIYKQGYGEQQAECYKDDGEITLATVIRYIRPMDITVSEVFRRHDRRMEELEAAISEEPSDNTDNEEDEE